MPPASEASEVWRLVEWWDCWLNPPEWVESVDNATVVDGRRVNRAPSPEACSETIGDASTLAPGDGGLEKLA